MKAFIDSNIIPTFIHTTLLLNKIDLVHKKELVLQSIYKILELNAELDLVEYSKLHQISVDKITRICLDCITLFISDTDYTKYSNNISDSVRLSVYSNLDAQKKYLYDSNKLKIDLLLACQKNTNLELPDNYKQLMIIVGDIVLGFYKVEDTVPLLQQELKLDAKTAALLGADVLDFLAPLSDPNFVIPVDNTTVDEVPAQRLSDIPLNSNLDQSVVSGTIPPASPYIPLGTAPTEIHTMASDAALVRPRYQPFTQTTETTYVSSQPTLSDLPSYAKPVTPTSEPKPTPVIETPRWGN